MVPNVNGPNAKMALQDGAPESWWVSIDRFIAKPVRLKAFAGLGSSGSCEHFEKQGLEPELSTGLYRGGLSKSPC